MHFNEQSLKIFDSPATDLHPKLFLQTAEKFAEIFGVLFRSGMLLAPLSHMVLRSVTDTAESKWRKQFRKLSLRIFDVSN
jgi:hypothetical protein